MSARQPFRSVFGFFMPLALAGVASCSYVSLEEGQRMQDQINQLKSQSQKSQEDLSAKLQQQSEDLRKLIDEARRLTTSLADSSQKSTQLQADQMQMQGKVEDLQRATDALQKSFTEYRAQSDTKLEQLVNATTAAKNPPLPETPDALFTEAQKKFDARQYNDARRMFDAFVNRYAADARAAKAQYNIGDAYFMEGKYANAIGALTKVVDNFPKSEVVEDAMFKNGQAFFALKYCSESKTYFQELLRRYPKTKFKTDASDQIKELARQAKNKAACQS